ncbi:glutamate-rich protein 5 isoform X1 [Equus asinus]|uniref:glutamate-rich protein 5 isoform X1 n=1 Tax=Equus asinus TaxID=9793 RepID=UPI00071A9A1A|nr:glutamate-rich protein 5 isoform X1 [Equus asinus]
MGCSSSVLSKAGDSSRPRSEESESCLAQPKAHTLGREPTFYSEVQKESLPPLQKLKISAVSTANGVKFLHGEPLAKDAADQPGSTEKTQPLEGPKESEPPQPGGKDDTSGVEEKKKNVEVLTEAQALKGNAEPEPLGAEANHQPLREAGERDSPGAMGGTEDPQTAGQMTPLGTAEKTPPPEAVREPQPQEAKGKDEQFQLPEAVPKETESPGILERCQLVETAEEQQPQETLGKDEQSQLLETIPRKNESQEVLNRSQLVKRVEEQQLQETLGKDEQSRLLETIPTENETPEVLDRSQLMERVVENDSLHKIPEGPGNMEQIQYEGINRSMEHSAGILETGTNMEIVRKIHTNEEEQDIEGETGEKVETEMENEKVEGAETKEEETGEAVDLSATT